MVNLRGFGAARDFLTPVLAAGNLSLEVPAFCVWGANTAVGKTLVSAGLARSARRHGLPTFYLKPVQTGFPDDSDASFVAEKATGARGQGPGMSTMGHHAATAAGRAQGCTNLPLTDGGGPAGNFWAHTEYAWRRAVGPHVAVAEEGRFVSDRALLASVTNQLAQFADTVVGPNERSGGAGIAFVETAGGVCSPGPSGTPQCDLLRPMRMPAILVGDGNLGGISTTLASLDVLSMRGYDVVAVVVADGGAGLGNSDAIGRYAATYHGCPTFRLPRVPERRVVGGGATAGSGEEIFEWMDEGAKTFDALLGRLVRWHDARIAKLRGAADEAREILWWPFTQHDMVPRENVAVIDSRSGEDFGVYVEDAEGAGPGSVQLRFDGAASWWTQGVSKELQHRLVRAAAAAAGRWGHVMFPENAHEAALDAARGLLLGAGRSWATRVFYSDNGSTAMEVAVKMAIRAFYVRKGHVDAGSPSAIETADALPQVRVLALDGSYHGDTLGTMDMQAPSVFTGPLQTPWYKPRGLFMTPPTLQLRKGRWVVTQPRGGIRPEFAGESWGSDEATRGWETRAEAFDWATRDGSDLARRYRSAVEKILDDAAADPTAAPVAALVMECVLHGAGGMDLIDPLFQRTLILVCKERGLPVVLDEVFAGIWRLGAEGAWELLGDDCAPDISCYAKLLTGGLVPLAITASTENVFDAFRGPTKTHALLHGHSYTAYPVGCAVAAEAMRIYRDPEANPNLIVEGAEPVGGEEGFESGDNHGGGLRIDRERPSGPVASSSDRKLRLRELWDETAVRDISLLPNVAGVTAIGCVLAVEVDDGGGGGYSSGAAKEIVLKLRAHSIQARPLGNVLYVMCAPTTAPERCAQILQSVTRELRASAMDDDDDAW